jgi:hypothetical protein
MPIKRADDRQRNVVHFVMKPGSAGRMPASRVKRSIAQPPRYQLSFINQSFCRIEGGQVKGSFTITFDNYVMPISSTCLGEMQ